MKLILLFAIFIVLFHVIDGKTGTGAAGSGVGVGVGTNSGPRPLGCRWKPTQQKWVCKGKKQNKKRGNERG